MLEEFGFANTTADRIAERAGTGKATLYRWWPNKTAVMIEALREAVAQELPLPDTGDLYEDIRLQLRILSSCSMADAAAYSKRS
jgi:AcrR family transcriptional regulator